MSYHIMQEAYNPLRPTSLVSLIAKSHSFIQPCHQPFSPPLDLSKLSQYSDSPSPSSSPPSLSFSYNIFLLKILFFLLGFYSLSLIFSPISLLGSIQIQFSDYRVNQDLIFFFFLGERDMANGVDENKNGLVLFSREELCEMSGIKFGADFVEITCGCTSHRYGDAVGRLRVCVNGDLEITCECTPGCLEDKLTPAAFEKHSGRETARKWKNNIWVIVDGDKVPLYKTVLLKYYNQALKGSNGSSRSQNGRVCHRDEFVRCSRCNKERRFRLRTKEECRSYHDTLADRNWTCADLPYDKISCGDDEERASRRIYRGCNRSATCKGCTSCVCFGCDICRFSDCSCQTCTDFTRNAKN